jgi:hypothetical protein
MTTEQIIVLGFIVAAFLAGWVASLVVRRRARLADDDWPPPPQRVEPVTAAAAGAPLAEEVGEALRSDAANDRMLSVVRDNGDAGLTGLELDLADWGFTYGVAWARARERARGGPDDAVAAEALDAAERVFRAYTGGADWTSQAAQRKADSATNGGPTPQDGSADAG